ncbi:MAG: hypothetical protein IJO06_12610 [Thermoguttaceae bacterium]|nr:hypothetical protein [Thermoguttaceae bacterium]
MHRSTSPTSTLPSFASVPFPTRHYVIPQTPLSVDATNATAFRFAVSAFADFAAARFQLARTRLYRF